MNLRMEDIEGDHVLSAVSRCLEDALEAALRGAFEVALQIALNDVSRLMGKALMDVKDQIYEIQQENITLKLRLQQIHDEQDNPKLLIADPNQSNIKSDNLDEDTDCVRQRSDKYVVESAKVTNGSLNESSHDERFYEITTSNINEKFTSKPEMEFKTDHIQHAESSDQDPPSFQPGFEQVQVKKEKAEPEEPVLDGSSGYGSDARPDYSFDQRSNEEFGLDRLALGQSKLLEDWRLDSEQQQNETEPLDQGPSHGVSLFPTSIDGLYQSADKTSLQPPQNCRDQMRTNVQFSLYACKFCGHAFHSKSDQHNHYIKYHKTVLKGKAASATRPKKQKRQRFPPGSRKFQCTVCNQNLKRLENLNTHMRIHTGERPYTCSVCGVKFRHGGALTRHFRIHTGEKPYICSECGRSFRHCEGLRFHQKSHSRAVYSLKK